MKYMTLNSDEIKLIQDTDIFILRTNIKNKVYKEATRLKLRTWDNNQGFSDGYGGIYDPEYSLEDIINVNGSKLLLKVIDIKAEKINNIWQWVTKFEKVIV